jgi:hypothetical protein
MTDTYTDDRGTIITNVHSESACAGRFCAIHNPSDHHMREWPLVWREAGLFDIKPSHFERMCPHGIGHPDPDSLEFWESIGEEGMGVHGCDGCCKEGSV